MAVEDTQTLVAGLAVRHGAQLRRFLVARVRNVADVPDIVQEVFLRMLRVRKVESIRSPEAYLFTVAQHVLQQHALRQSAMPPSAELARMFHSQHPDPDADPALEMDAHECLEQLQGALDDFPPKVRATFIMSRRDGMSFDEIASCLGTSRPMVKKYLMKALMQLRQRLEKAE